MSNDFHLGLGGKKLTAEWASVTTKNLWKSICDEALHYYGYELKARFELNLAYPKRKIIQVETMDALCEQYGIQRVSLLRRICRVLGIQLLAKVIKKKIYIYIFEALKSIRTRYRIIISSLRLIESRT